ncbi:hypothetical protein LB504_000187 [Fusarium proliferatum]|nr:hypothetical protein LB504_000187 [Fusarium proliferatum]
MSQFKRCSLQANAGSASPPQSVPRDKVTFCLGEIRFLGKTTRQRGRHDSLCEIDKPFHGTLSSKLG